MFSIDTSIVFQSVRACGHHICEKYQKIGKIDKEHQRYIQIISKFYLKRVLAESKLCYLSFTYSYEITSEMQLSLSLSFAGYWRKRKNSQFFSKQSFSPFQRNFFRFFRLKLEACRPSCILVQGT